MKTIRQVCNNIFYVLKILWKTSKLAFIIQIVFGFFTGIISSLMILINKYLIDTLTQDVPELRNILWLLFLTFLIKFLPNIISSFLGALYNPLQMWKFIQKMNNIMLEKIKKIDLECFENYIFYDQYTRAMSEADNRSQTVFSIFTGFISSFVSLVSVISVIIILDPIIILMAVIIVAFNFFIDIIINKINYQNNIDYTPFQRKNAYVKRVFYQPQYAKDLKINKNLADIFINMYNSNIKNINSITVKYGKKLSFIYALKSVVNNILAIGVTGYLCYMVLNKGMSIGTFVSLQSATESVIGNLNSFLTSFSNFYNQSLYIDNLKTILDYKSKIEKKKGITLEKNIGIKIDIKNMSFCYAGSDKNVLNNIDITIRSGEKAAIVGHNGAGKTTLMKLLIRLYDVSSGEIDINGINIKEYDVDSLRKNTSIVFQDFNTYGITIAQSIMSKEKINKNDEELVWKCLKKVGLKEKVESLPNTIDTVLSMEFEGGINLSGGEQQKLAAAAAFAQNAGLLLFDEPSSQLDPVSEYNLYKTIYELSEDKTTIIISHRLSSVVDADKIFYMEKGSIEETGTHEELMALNGKYAKMFNLQSQSYLTGIKGTDIFI